MKQTKKLTEGKVKSNIKRDIDLKETLPPPSPKCKKCKIPELSDEEIENISKKEIWYNEDKRCWVIEGMKLYREQLKSKQ